MRPVGSARRARMNRRRSDCNFHIAAKSLASASSSSALAFPHISGPSSQIRNARTAGLDTVVLQRRDRAQAGRDDRATASRAGRRSCLGDQHTVLVHREAVDATCKGRRRPAGPRKLPAIATSARPPGPNRPASGRRRSPGPGRGWRPARFRPAQRLGSPESAVRPRVVQPAQCQADIAARRDGVVRSPRRFAGAARASLRTAVWRLRPRD